MTPPLQTVREDILFGIEDFILRLDGNATRDRLIAGVERLCLQFHILAFASLLVDANPQMFFLNLCRAAENWRRLLKKCHNSAWVPPPVSKNAPLLGAIVAANDGLRRQLVDLSAVTWQRSEEHEEKFCFAVLLQTFSGRLIDESSEIEDLIARYEACSAGSDDAAYRVQLLRSISARDEVSFFDAFSNMLLVRESLIEQQADSFTIPAHTLASQRYVWLEGLALLRIAQHLGFTGQGEYLGSTGQGGYLYCPALALGQMAAPYEGDWVISVGEA